jgi:hypothetical protein
LQRIALPITPGQQHFELKWLEARGIATQFWSSAVDLGAGSVNASIDIYLPRSRWTLFVGGEQLVGPYGSALVGPDYHRDCGFRIV